VLGAAGVVLLVLSMMPRVGGRRAAAPATADRPARTRRFAGARNGDGTTEPVGARTTDAERRT
jgi:hypothetical protein